MFTDMPCKRITEVDGEPLRVHIQDTSDKVRLQVFMFNSVADFEPLDMQPCLQ